MQEIEQCIGYCWIERWKKSHNAGTDVTIGANVACTWSQSVQLNLTLDPCARNASRPIRIASKRLGLHGSSMLSSLMDKGCSVTYLPRRLPGTSAVKFRL